MLIARRTLHAVCSCLRFVDYTSPRAFSYGSHLWKEMKRAANGGVMLRRLRYREKLGRQLDPPSYIDLAVIGSGVNGSPKSFIINSDHARWVLFGLTKRRRADVPDDESLSGPSVRVAGGKTTDCLPAIRSDWPLSVTRRMARRPII